MGQNADKPVEIIELAGPDFNKLSCPFCNSKELKISHSKLRTVPDLGTKKIRKILRFESIHIECKVCSKIFYYQRDEIVPGISASKEVLDTVLAHYFDFEDPAEKIVERMETFYSVKLKPHTILRWTRIYGDTYCQKNNSVHQEHLKNFSGHLALDGTFPKIQLDTNNEPPVTSSKKRRVPWLRLTALKDGTLCAIWQEEKMS